MAGAVLERDAPLAEVLESSPFVAGLSFVVDCDVDVRSMIAVTSGLS